MREEVSAGERRRRRSARARARSAARTVFARPVALRPRVQRREPRRCTTASERHAAPMIARLAIEKELKLLGEGLRSKPVLLMDGEEAA